jgi:aspartate racemase
MKKIGIIGGIGPESTLDYYRGIIDAFKPEYERSGYPEIIIDSLDLRSTVSLMDGKWDELVSLFAERFERLRFAGADFGVIASNSPHRVFDAIKHGTRLPLLSIVDETCRNISKKGMTSVCLLGTASTMRSGFYAAALAERGIRASVPEEEEIDYIQEKLFTEIELGVIKDATREELVRIIGRVHSRTPVEGVILGCTELPLILRPGDFPFDCINTTAIHVEGIVRLCRES